MTGEVLFDELEANYAFSQLATETSDVKRWQERYNANADNLPDKQFLAARLPSAEDFAARAPFHVMHLGWV